MGHGAATTRRSGTRNRAVFGLVAAAWLNLAIQPCALAMAGDADCSHCPPAQAASHHDHTAAVAEKAPCDILADACGDTDKVGLDGRAGKAKVKDAVELPVALVQAVPSFAAAPAKQAIFPTGPPPTAGVAPPLNVLFCVYLK